MPASMYQVVVYCSIGLEERDNLGEQNQPNQNLKFLFQPRLIDLREKEVMSNGQSMHR